MDINAGIVDQYVRRIAENYPTELILRGKDTEDRRRSNAFCLLCVKMLLALDDEQALRCLTDGGQDGGIDAISYGDVVEGEFVVTLFQAKYHNNLEGTKGFETETFLKLIATIEAIFDPGKPLGGMKDIQPTVEEIRSMIRDGFLPQVRAVLCNNGVHWSDDAEMRIRQSNSASSPQVSFEHLNHDRLVDLLKRQVEIVESLQLDGKAVVDSFNFRRVLIGKVNVEQIRAVVAKHAERLFDRNIRRYLGWNNRVNSGMIQTLKKEDDRHNFYFYNNGITLICSKFSYNALQNENWIVKASDLQIINGGQTCQSIHHAVSEAADGDFSQAFVLIRLYELDNDDKNLIHRITNATNSQSPIELRDLRSNDDVQKRIEIDLEPLGYDYKSKRDNSFATSKTIPSSVAAEAVLAVWRLKPHLAKFATTKLFDQFYEEIFQPDLTGAQVVLAVLLYREMHNERRKPTRPNPPFFLPYASHHLAMIVGQLLTKRLGVTSNQITHLNFASIHQDWSKCHDELYDQAVSIVEQSLLGLAVDPSTNLQRVAAQFRRGDLLENISSLMFG